MTECSELAWYKQLGQRGEPFIERVISWNDNENKIINHFNYGCSGGSWNGA